MKSTTPIIILTFIISLIFIADFFLPGLSLDGIVTEINNGGVIIAAFAMGLAAVNLTRIHVRRVMNKRSGYFNSILLLIGLFYMLIVGLSMGATAPAYEFGFDNIYTPLGATMYASLAFWIASAAYRAFIARSVEAGILLISATIVLLGKAPVGVIIWSQFPALGKWIMNVPNAAAMRGIMIGAAIGAIAMGIRIMVGIERGYLGSSDQ